MAPTSRDDPTSNPTLSRARRAFQRALNRVLHVALQRFVHADHDEDAAGGAEHGDGPYRGTEAEGIGRDSREKCADGEPGVAPKATDADRAASSTLTAPGMCPSRGRAVYSKSARAVQGVTAKSTQRAMPGGGFILGMSPGTGGYASV